MNRLTLMSVAVGLSMMLLESQTAKAANAGIPAPEKLLPAETRFFVSSPGFRVMLDDLQKTQFGRLYQDPLLKPFRANLRGKVARGMALNFLGLPFNDLRIVARGPLAWATVAIDKGKAGHLLLLDVNSKGKELDRILKARAKIWTDNEGKERTEVYKGVTLTIMERTTSNGATQTQIHGIKDHLLVAGSSLELVKGVFSRWEAPKAKSLADVPVFQVLAKRTQPREKSVDQLRFFIDLPGLRELTPATNKPTRGKDRWAQLNKAGLNGFQALGGFLSFNSHGHDLYYHIALQAPRPHERGMGIIQLQNGKDYALPSWIQPSISTFTQVNMDLPKAFDAFGFVYDQIVADGAVGTFKETLDDLKKDPNIKLDLRKDLIEQMKNPILVVTDTTLPVGLKSNRFLLAIPIKNKKTVTQALLRFYRGDDRVKSRPFRNRFTIWETIPNINDKDSLSVPYHAITVSETFLYIANSAPMLENVLRKEDDAKTEVSLTDQMVYKRYLADIKQLSDKPVVGRQFSILKHDLNVVYEMARQNKLAEASSIYAQGVLWLLKRGNIQFDGAVLPEFNKVSHYLGTMGSITRNTPEGWELIGFCRHHTSGKVEK